MAERGSKRERTKGGDSSRPSGPEFKLKLIDSATTIGLRVLKVSGWVLVARYAYLSIVALAGKQTFADVGLRVLANFTFSQATAWTVGGAGLIYGEAHRRLRKRTIQTMGDRIKELEQAIDPNRSSSKILRDGSTRPEDDDE